MAAPAHDPESRRRTPLTTRVNARESRDSDEKPSPSTSPSSLSSSSATVPAVIASPPTENDGTSPPRQKRWATKTRTGCITCRIRRVKCDEAKPMCNRCMTSGRMCDGYKNPPKKPAKQSAAPTSRTTTEPRAGANDDAQAVYLPGARVHFAVVLGQDDLVPPDWDLMEALHYCLFTPVHPTSHSASLIHPNLAADYRTIFPSLNANQLDDNTAAFMPTAGNLGCKTSFITFIFSNRIADAAKKRGTLRSPEHMPYDQYLWTAFHASMVALLAIINERLSSSDGAVNDSVFVRIVDMLSIDLTLLGSSWQAHLHGYGALYKMRGGYKRLSKVLKSFDYQFQYVYMLHVLTSTTTPAARMLTIFDDLTSEEIHHVFTFSLYSDVPCSSHVFADLVRINRLRALVAHGAPVTTFVRPAARQVYRHIAEFSVDDWEEPYGVPDKPEARLLCRLFQQAVLLYGLLTLPPLGPAAVLAAEEKAAEGVEKSSSLPSPESSGPETGNYAAASEEEAGALRDEEEAAELPVAAAATAAAAAPSIEALRHDILALMREILPLIPQRPTSLAWPLAVVGVTLSGEGDAPEREFVAQTLHRISTHRDAYYGPTLCLSKLRRFWASRKTGWEDCYDEACAVMA
ncbi:Zn(2)-C6 fungal-type DNA-binding domain protein [Cordyceps fumosorosea ARSEF 2679]|uniref:Zn(2)-C6 fungal-type DNA-binding domain protein n=1 Tax=Cordyceps fumosorosea (strain ARSEF 2679) TaxID=1081104 RepID=A0A167VXN4_CORFA|nr:Zn(2)-C6 fungal-type DNA-binding domain protein [Cordyceps fumosorosea ARSEF 2679]OAA63096.1 Zn(2)-C6 fungal-type DNA-binding domain protein [Cordyceps fumosorosea ARSEF 2679]